MCYGNNQELAIDSVHKGTLIITVSEVDASLQKVNLLNPRLS